MSEPPTVGLPGWVYKRDGRLVPFEADRISQALFAATESLGRADAFLARELTDGILHFLARENPAVSIPTTGQIAELVATVVRELGQPGLAQAFVEGQRKGLKAQENREVRQGPGRPAQTGLEAIVPFQFSLSDPPGVVVQDCLREYSLRAIFSRDLVAAHRDGLLTLTGLEAPQQLVGCVFDLTGRGLEPGEAEKSAWPASRRSGALVQALQQIRNRVGTFLAVDSPEYTLSPFASAGDLAKNSGELQAGLDATGLGMVVNLNTCAPPRWAEEPPEGPLFAEPRRSPPAHLEEYRTVLLEQLNRPAIAGRVRIDWHLSDRDFAGAESASRLCRLVRWALDFPAFSFTFDRPDRPISLGEGIDRKFPTVLLEVGLHLPRLLELPGVRGNPENFLLKLHSLVRMGVSAGVQKRNYLRGQAGLGRGFLLDRARLVVVPVGLEATVRGLGQQGMGTEAAGAKLAAQILSSLQANLRAAAQLANLDVAVDGPCWSSFSSADGFAFPERQKRPGFSPTPGQVAGLTPWDHGSPAKNQLQAAGALHTVVAGGSAAVLLPQDPIPAPEDLAFLLAYAWKQTEVVRLRFVPLPHRQQQLSW